MNEQEHAAIVGQVVLELGKVNQQLGALEIRARDWARSLREVADYLHAEADYLHAEAPLHVVRNLSGKEWQEAFARMPSREEVGALAAEITALSQRKSELAMALKKQGVDL